MLNISDIFLLHFLQIANIGLGCLVLMSIFIFGIMVERKQAKLDKLDEPNASQIGASRRIQRPDRLPNVPAAPC